MKDIFDKLFDDAEAEARGAAVKIVTFNAAYPVAIEVKDNLKHVGWDVSMCAPNEDGKAATEWELWLMRGDAEGFVNAVHRAVNAATMRSGLESRNLVPA